MESAVDLTEELAKANAHLVTANKRAQFVLAFKQLLKDHDVYFTCDGNVYANKGLALIADVEDLAL